MPQFHQKTAKERFSERGREIVMEQRSKLDICHKIHSGKASLNLMSERKARISEIISNSVINIYDLDKLE